MKKIIFLALIILQAVTMFSQAQVSKEAYLKKSKNQKKIGTILLAGGGALVLAGFLYPRGDYEQNITQYYATKTYPNDGTKIALAGTGVAAMLASIPFYIASGKNKRRANAISINIHNRQIVLPQQGSDLVVRLQPSVTVRLPL